MVLTASFGFVVVRTQSVQNALCFALVGFQQ